MWLFISPLFLHKWNRDETEDQQSLLSSVASDYWARWVDFRGKGCRLLPQEPRVMSLCGGGRNLRTLLCSWDVPCPSFLHFTHTSPPTACLADFRLQSQMRMITCRDYWLSSPSCMNSGPWFCFSDRPMHTVSGIDFHTFLLQVGQMLLLWFVLMPCDCTFHYIYQTAIKWVIFHLIHRNKVSWKQLSYFILSCILWN